MAIMIDEQEQLVKNVMKKVVENLPIDIARHVFSAMGAEFHKKHSDEGWKDYQEVVIENVCVKFHHEDQRID